MLKSKQLFRLYKIQSLHQQDNIYDTSVQTDNIQSILLIIIIVQMNQNVEAKQVAQLRQRIKQLQKQMCQRTRNYLLHKGMGSPPPSPIKSLTFVKLDVSVQTDIETFPQITTKLDDSNRSFGVALSPKNNTEDNFLNGQDRPNMQINMFKYSTENGFHDNSQNKNRICDVLFKVVEQRRQMEVEKDDNQTVAEIPYEEEGLNREHKEFREVLKLRKEIKKLKSKLQFQREVYEEARTGLMVSEEQNYQFRLKIDQLIKQLEAKSESKQEAKDSVNLITQDQLQKEIYDRDQLIVKLQDELTHEKEMKQEYLDSCLSAKVSIDNMADRIQALQAQINYLTNKIENERKKSSIQSCIIQQQLGLKSKQNYMLSQSFLQALKQISFSISNCIPVTQDYEQEANFFRPENQYQILQALKRVEDYCKNIQKWHKIQQEAMQFQKSIFLKLVETISSKIDDQIKIQISKELKSQQRFKIYQRIFTPEPEKHRNNTLQEGLNKYENSSQSYKILEQ